MEAAKKGGLKTKAAGEAEKDDGRAGKGETQSLDEESLPGQRCFGGLLYDVSDQRRYSREMVLEPSSHEGPWSMSNPEIANEVASKSLVEKGLVINKAFRMMLSMPSCAAKFDTRGVRKPLPAPGGPHGGPRAPIGYGGEDDVQRQEFVGAHGGVYSGGRIQLQLRFLSRMLHSVNLCIQ